MSSKFIRRKLSALSIFLMAVITPLVFVSSSGYTQTPSDSEQTPSDSEQTPSDSKGTSDYLNSVTASDECSKSVEKRQGKWFCSSVASAATRETVAAAQYDLGTEAVSDAEVQAAGIEGHCTIQGCWTILNEYTASYVGSGEYGYGGIDLGKASMYFKVTAKGRKLTVGPVWFRSTRGTLRPVLEAEVLYISAAYPQGNHQDPRQDTTLYDSGILPAGQDLDWKPYPYWYDKIQVPTVAVEASWEDPSSAYPGVWYMYAKSIKFKRNNLLNGQYYIPSYSLPKDQAGAGWRPD